MSARNTRDNVVFLGAHMGQTFHHFADSYPTIETVIQEAVQNAFDPDVLAQNVSITVNEKGRTVTITDDGKGISQQLFVDRIGTVCTRHRKGPNATGQFGIGLMASLGKCKRFRFVSCPGPLVDRYTEWVFDSAAILAAREMPPVSQRPRPDLVFGKPIKWRSMIQLEEVTKDVSISRVDMGSLVRKILTNHRQKMLALNAKVSICIVRMDGTREERSDIQASRFRGEPLDDFLTAGPNVGQAIFRLFRSPETVGRDKGPGLLVGVSGDDFRLPFEALAKDVTGLGVDPHAIAALKSGLFEGEILFESLTLLASRRGFAKTDALNDVAVAISRWFKRAGSKLYDEMQQERRSTRNIDRGKASMAAIEKLLQEFPDIDEAIRSAFKVGSVGKGHSRVPRTRVVGERKAGSVDGLHRGSSGSGGAQGRSDKPRELKDHTPFTVEGLHEPRRILVRDNSLGLCIGFDMLEGEDLFRFEKETGQIIFNALHPVWAAAEDDGDNAVCALQEFCMLSVLSMLRQPEQEQDAVLRFILKTAALSQQWFLKGKALRAM